MLSRVLTGVVIAGASATVAEAASFSDIQFWVGSGQNESALVIDWNDGVSPESLVWGYRWDGVKTGADMLLAVDAADARLSVDGSVSGYGLYVRGISYDSSPVLLM